uniref:Uncharacterized protein n=1 Tax=Kalanchoe fedtschenkoi TaxID=63787 RepID=A0A7N0T5V7_KALFE
MLKNVTKFYNNWKIRNEDNTKTLGSKHDSAASLLNLLLSSFGNQFRLHHNGLGCRKHPLPQDLEVPELRDIDQRKVIRRGLVLHLLRHERPQLVDVDDRAVELVAKLMEVAHADLAEVSGMVLVEEDAVVVHASSVTAPSGMLTVLADTAVAGADVAALLTVLPKAGGHWVGEWWCSGWKWCGDEELGLGFCGRRL